MYKSSNAPFPLPLSIPLEVSGIYFSYLQRFDEILIESVLYIKALPLVAQIPITLAL